MKIAIVVSCLLAIAAARNLKREEGEGRPVTANEGKEFISALLKFGGEIHGHIQGLDGEAAAMLEGNDWKESAKIARQIIDELKGADKEAQEMMSGYGKGLENLMYYGVEGLNDCHKLAGVMHYMTSQAENAGEDAEFWGTYLKVVRGNAVCLSARFGAFGGYLEWLREAMSEDGEGQTAGGKKRQTRSLNSLLREFESFKRHRGRGGDSSEEEEGPRPTGDFSGEGRHPKPSGERHHFGPASGSGERRHPTPTGGHSGSGERHPRPSGEEAEMKREEKEMFEGMTDEEIGTHLYMTASANFEIEAHAVVVGYGMQSLHGRVSFFVKQLDQVVPEQTANREVAALRSLLLKARVLNNAMNANMHLLR